MGVVRGVELTLTFLDFSVLRLKLYSLINFNLMRAETVNSFTYIHGKRTCLENNPYEEDEHVPFCLKYPYKLDALFDFSDKIKSTSSYSVLVCL
jgi:hypothetical protein